MSKIHILTADNGIYQVVIHTAIPVGTNSAGETWKDCWVAAGRAVTSLVEGVEGWNISTAEKSDVEDGTKMEFKTALPAESGGGTNESMNDMVDEFLVGAKASAQAEMKYFGHTIG